MKINDLNTNLANKSDKSHTHTLLNIGLAYKDYDIQLHAGSNINTMRAWDTKEALACSMVYTSSQEKEPCICMIDNEYAMTDAAMIRIQTASGAVSANGGDYRVRLWYVAKL